MKLTDQQLYLVAGFILQIGIFAYGYGRLTQKVTEALYRLNRVERLVEKYILRNGGEL